MTANDAIKKIKLMLGIEKFSEQKSLIDGTLIEANPAFEVGAQLSVVAEDGLVPAPEGQHQTEDGMLLTVDAAGVIVEISEVVSEDLEKEEEEMSEDEDKEKMEDKEEKMEEEVVEEITEDIVSEIVQVIAPLVEDIVKIKEDIEEFKKDFSAKFAKFSEEPAGKPVKNNFSAANTLVDKRIEKLAEIRKTLKQNK